MIAGMMKGAFGGFPLLQNHKMTMHTRLMMYLIVLIIAGISTFTMLLTMIWGHLGAEAQIAKAMENQIAVVKEQMMREMETYTGYGLQLSRELKQDIEGYLEEEGITISDLNDNPDALLDLEKMMYTELNTVLRLAHSSGAFAIVNATVNTSLSDASNSRAGVYLRLKGIGQDVTLSPETTLFRGNAAVARENSLILHSRWNLELSTDMIPGYAQMTNNIQPPQSGYYWSNRINLKNTGDDVISLLVPIYSDSGTFLGACGIELNENYFLQNYPAAGTDYGPIVTVAGPLENGKLRLDNGMTGNTEGTWIDAEESLPIVNQNDYYNTYRSSDDVYYGIQEELGITGFDDQKWAVAVLMPGGICDRYIWKNNMSVVIIMIIVAMVMIVVAWMLSKKYVRPIVQSFQNIREGQQPAVEGAGLSELEALCACLAQRDNEMTTCTLPPHMDDLLHHFAENVKTLTNAEYSIFQYYMQGYKVSQIPSAACISMSTVKKHNGNIYRKLEISSYEELMMYLDLFNRCGYMDQLMSKKKAD